VSFDNGIALQSIDTYRAIYDRGDYFDQLDVVPGTTDMEVRGALRFFIAPEASYKPPPAQLFSYSVSDGGDYTHTEWTPLDYAHFTAVKHSNTTRLKITWTDSFRVISDTSGGACAWHLEVNNGLCAPVAIVLFDHASQRRSDKHRTTTTVKICEDIPAGPVDLQVTVRRRDGDEDCHRGHPMLNPDDSSAAPATIIVEEVP
jgi:hypothetical protein